MLIIISIATLIALTSFSVLNYVHLYQNVSYMDEIFHVPQAQQYCSYNFSSWDPMITTLPGLYLVSLVQLLPFAFWRGLSVSELCTTQNLRMTNVTYSFGNFVLLFLLVKRLTSTSQICKQIQARQILNAAVLALFPVQYFFTWLYYTDPGATFFTLLMYVLCLHGYHKASAASAVLAILFRQTTVVWVLFCMGTVAIRILNEQLRLDKKMDDGEMGQNNNTKLLMLILQSIFASCERFFSLVTKVLAETASYLCVLIGFTVFVVVNKGIVVGDKSHHVTSYNFPQLFYFLLISVFFSFVHFIRPRQILSSARAALKTPLRALLLAVIACLLIRFFTYEHKYLLSDNRHYPFYLWSKIFRRHHLARYLLVPVYLYSLYQFWQLTLHRGILWRVIFSLCTAVCLVPQALLEFRYFIVPFYILRLNMKLPSLPLLVLELLFYVSVNAFTVFMFTQRPFQWPGDPAPQRFMW